MLFKTNDMWAAKIKDFPRWLDMIALSIKENKDCQICRPESGGISRSEESAIFIMNILSVTLKKRTGAVHKRNRELSSLLQECTETASCNRKNKYIVQDPGPSTSESSGINYDSHIRCRRKTKVSQAWDLLKGRPVPQMHQEFVDSKQRLRAALRNLKTIQDVPSNDKYRWYRITDLQEQRIKTETKVDISEIKVEIKSIPDQPRRSCRKVKAEKFMYDDESSSELWTPPRRHKSCVKSRKNVTLKKRKECTETAGDRKINYTVQDPGPSTSEEYTETAGDRKINYTVQDPGPSTSETTQFFKKENDDFQITSVILKKGTGAVLKRNRDLASLLQSSGINYDSHIRCRRKTKVSQEAAWSSVEMKFEVGISESVGVPIQTENQETAASTQNESSKKCAEVQECTETAACDRKN